MPAYAAMPGVPIMLKIMLAYIRQCLTLIAFTSLYLQLPTIAGACWWLAYRSPRLNHFYAMSYVANGSQASSSGQWEDKDRSFSYLHQGHQGLFQHSYVCQCMTVITVMYSKWLLFGWLLHKRKRVLWYQLWSIQSKCRQVFSNLKVGVRELFFSVQRCIQNLCVLFLTAVRDYITQRIFQHEAR